VSYVSLRLKFNNVALRFNLHSRFISGWCGSFYVKQKEIILLNFY